MSEKNKVNTSILGENIILVSNESEDYIKKISSCINERFNAIKNNSNTNYKTLLLLVNLADDLLKEKQKANQLEKELLSAKNNLAKANYKLKNYSQSFKQEKIQKDN